MNTNEGTGAWTKDSEREKVKIPRLWDIVRTVVQIPASSYAVTKRK